MNTVAVDAMGGDHAPEPEVSGAIEAARDGALRVVLFGDEPKIRAELERHEWSGGDAIRVVHADEVVTMDDHPVRAYRQKPGSSLRAALDALSAGDVDAVVSAGNSGAVLSHALFVVGRLPGVERPGIATMLPTPTGNLILCDSGANVDVKPSMLAQFAALAATYARVLGLGAKPKVGLLSNGRESSKGTALTREASELIEAAAREGDFDYSGYVEANHIFDGDIDVLATDGFTGNVVLKLAEGVSEMVMKMVKGQLETSVRAKVGAPLVKPALRKLKQMIHYSEAGGAALLGVRKLVLIAHGRSDAVAIKNAIKRADFYQREGLVEGLSRVAKTWQKESPDQGSEAP